MIERQNANLRLRPVALFLRPDILMTVDNVEAVVWDLSRQVVVGRYLWKEGLEDLPFFKLSKRAGHDQIVLTTPDQLELWTVPLSTGQPFIRKALQLSEPNTLALIEPPVMGIDPFGKSREDLISGMESVVSPDGKWLAIQRRGKISLWDLQQLKKQRELETTGDLALFFPSGQPILAGVAKDRIYTWQLPDLRSEPVVWRFGGPVKALAATFWFILPARGRRP